MPAQWLGMMPAPQLYPGIPGAIGQALSSMAQGYNVGQQRKMYGQDVQDLQNAIQRRQWLSQMAPGADRWLGGTGQVDIGQFQMPQFRSPQMQQMAAQNLMGTMGRDPTVQARNLAMAEYYRYRAQPQAPQQLTPSGKQIQRRLDRIDFLEAIPDAQRTPPLRKELASLKRLAGLAEREEKPTPSQKMAQKRLAYAEKFEPGSPQWANALGMSPGQQYPEAYKADLKNAVSAIGRGADPAKVYRRIASEYPQLSAELKRVILYTPASKRLELLREALFGGS